MTFDQFRKKWNGKKADYDGMFGGECVDLYNFYMRDVMKLDPYKYGAVVGASQLQVNLPKYKELQWVKNKSSDKDQLPPKGAIMVFDNRIGGGFGHVGMVVSAKAGNLQLFDQLGALVQKNEKPSATRNQTKLWTYCIGWAINDASMRYVDLNNGYAKYKADIEKVFGFIPEALNNKNGWPKYQNWDRWAFNRQLAITQRKAVLSSLATIEVLKSDIAELKQIIEALEFDSKQNKVDYQDTIDEFKQKLADMETALEIAEKEAERQETEVISSIWSRIGEWFIKWYERIRHGS